MIYLLSALCIFLYVLGLPVMVCAFRGANKRNPESVKEYRHVFLWPLRSIFAFKKAFRKKR